MSDQEIPEGTVTVLFTDLVESTRLNQTLGDDAAREVGRQVESMARQIVADQRGVLIKEMGDGLMAAFASARRAVAASREIQVEMGRLRRGGLDENVAMRIGLHTGEVLSEDGDIHGETVIIAKRIEGLAPSARAVRHRCRGSRNSARRPSVTPGRSIAIPRIRRARARRAPTARDRRDTRSASVSARPSPWPR
jgi:class 3 adenylate cyclase